MRKYICAKKIEVYVSGMYRVSVLCWLATLVANVLWKPLEIG